MKLLIIIFSFFTLHNSFACMQRTFNTKIEYNTNGQGLYDVHTAIQSELSALLVSHKNCGNGILHLFIMHTSAALLITESSDPDAKTDVENFLNWLAPEHGKERVPYLHTLEGKDDPPSHLKSVVLHQHLAMPVESGKISMGTWQKVYLGEFRDLPKNRKIIIKYQVD